jgi:flagellar protein FliL
MANAENVEVATPVVAVKKSGGKRMMLIVGVVLLVLLGIGGFMFVGQRSVQAKSAAGAPATASAVNTTAVYLPLEPVFVVNFQDDDATRYLQVGVTVMSHDPAAVQAMKDNDPVIRNALVILFSSQTFAELSNTAGKQKLQAQALTAVRKIVVDKIGKPGVDALYFTSFVMQ